MAELISNIGFKCDIGLPSPSPGMIEEAGLDIPSSKLKMIETAFYLHFCGWKAVFLLCWADFLFSTA
jgi:hypothetical protein